MGWADDPWIAYGCLSSVWGLGFEVSKALRRIEQLHAALAKSGSVSARRGWEAQARAPCRPALKHAALRTRGKAPFLAPLSPAEAQLGQFKGPHPVPGGGRILQALRTGGAGK